MIPPMARIDMPKEPVAAFCRKYGVRRLALFGSVLTDMFRPDSDVDVLVGSLISILEPVMVVMLGLMVGFIVVCLACDQCDA